MSRTMHNFMVSKAHTYYGYIFFVSPMLGNLPTICAGVQVIFKTAIHFLPCRKVPKLCWALLLLLEDIFFVLEKLCLSPFSPAGLQVGLNAILYFWAGTIFLCAAGHQAEASTTVCLAEHILDGVDYRHL